MRRRLLTAFSFASLAICFAASTLWVWSYFEAVTLSWGGWAPAPTPPTAGPDDFTLREDSGHLLAGRGSLSWFRRTQVVTAPSFAASDLLTRNPRVRPRPGRTPLGAGNEYGPPRTAPGVLARLGFYASSSPGRSPDTRLVERAIPLWAIALPVAIPPLAWFVAWRRRVRYMREGRRCLACGYDLRATPDRCPECGTVAAGSVAAPTSA